jgi:hypothetical protein
LWVLPADLAWVAIALLWIRAAYKAFLRNQTNRNADNDSFTAMKYALIGVLVLLVGAHGVSFFLKQVRDWPYRTILAQVDQMSVHPLLKWNW